MNPKATVAESASLTAEQVAAAPAEEVMRLVNTSDSGLSSAEATARLARSGPNAVRTHRVHALAVLGRQLRNAVLAAAPSRSARPVPR